MLIRLATALTATIIELLFFVSFGGCDACESTRTRGMKSQCAPASEVRGVDVWSYHGPQRLLSLRRAEARQISGWQKERSS